MAVPLLWLQGAVREKKIEMARIAEKDNPADVLTKFFSREDLDRHCPSFGIAATAARTTRIS